MIIKGCTELPVLSKPVSFLIIVISSLCFANNYNGEFAFDDTEAIVKNDDVKHTPLWDVFKNDFWGKRLSHKQSHKSYRPLTILTFRFQFWLRGDLIAQDFHIVNTVLNAIVCILTFVVLTKFLSSEGKNIAFYTTLLFAVHPVHTEAVSGIVGRAELLCAAFTWLSVLLYDQSVCAKQLFFEWLSMFGCVLCISVAMLCKETGITAVGLCAVYDLITRNNVYPKDILNSLISWDSYKEGISFMRLNHKLLSRMLVLFLTTAILLALRFSIMGFAPPTFQPADNPASFMDNAFFRGLNYSYIYFLNVWLLICPEWLCFDWSMGCVPLIIGFDQRILIIIIFWSVLGALVAHTFTATRDRFLRCSCVGLAILIIPFLPASNIFFNVGFVLAERTLYIPSVGYCLLFVTGLQKFCTRFSVTKIALLFYGILILLFFTRSWIRSDQWRAERILFRSALRVCPLNAKVHYNIAADAGNSTLARLEYNEALRLNPNYTQAMNNLGNLLKDQKKYKEAEILFRRAVGLQKDFATAWMNLGIVLTALKRYDESEHSFSQALLHRSKYPDCYYNMGVSYLEQKRYEEALVAWSHATRLNPAHRRAWTNTILLLDDLNMPENALEMANQALQFIPDHASIYFNIANILGKASRFLEAEVQFKNAISRNPADPMFYTNLGVLYHRWNKAAEAEEMYKKALELKPDLQSAKENLRKLQLLKS